MSDPQAGFFAPDSMLRRVHSEGIVLIGGGRALLMQIAHPSVARGVAEHSTYRTQRLQRLLRTLRSTLAIGFGTREQALEAAASINAIHEGVRGEGYEAKDPELLAWVLATLIDTGLLAYQRFVRPLTPEEAEAYYRDMCRFGQMLALPPGAMPEGLDAFHAYVAGMVESLEVGQQARDITEVLFQPLPATGPAMALMRQLTAGLLPPRLRREFGLSWGPGREAQLRVAARLSRLLLPRLPMSLRGTPSFLLPAPATRAASDRR